MFWKPVPDSGASIKFTRFPEERGPNRLRGHSADTPKVKEIGERLSLALGPQSSELSPALLALIEQLAKRESYNSNQNFTGLNE
jgi:hypothetical protein